MNSNYSNLGRGGLSSADVSALITDQVPNPLTVVKGGTGADTAVEAHDALSTSGSDIASAATTDLSTATGVFVNITGTTTITALGTAPAGVVRVLCFASTLILTHNATSLILPGGQSIVTTQGDIMSVRSLGSGNWKLESFLPYRRGTRLRLLNWQDGAWTRSNSGTVTLNTAANGNAVQSVAGSVTGTATAYFNVGGTCNYFPGTRTQIDYSKSFRFRFSYILYMGANPSTGTRVSIHLGSTTTPAHDLAEKGLAIQWIGNGTVPTVRIQGHSGSSNTNSTAATQTASDESVHDVELVWVNGVGGFLFIDGTLVASLTGNPVSGLGVANSTRTATLTTGINTDASGATLRLIGQAIIEVAS